MKTCSKCKENKELEQFYLDRSAKDGRRYNCIECCKAGRNREGDKEYRERNKDKVKPVPKEIKKLRNDRYYAQNKEKVKKLANEYYLNNRDKKLSYQKDYQSNNKDKRNAYLVERRNNDPMFRLITNIRNLIYNSFYYNGYVKKSRTHEILGCSFEELKSHLEVRFEHWMTWDNKGVYNGEFDYGWDIDHIVPLSTAESEEDLIRLSHYTNLQPLCSKVNRDIKKNNLEHGLL
jgi:hypothetical protein